MHGDKQIKRDKWTRKKTWRERERERQKETAGHKRDRYKNGLR